MRICVCARLIEAMSEDVLSEDSTSDTAWRNLTFNGYAPSGDVTAPAVYANYGRPEDFDALAAAGVDVRGKVRFGNVGDGKETVPASGICASVKFLLQPASLVICPHSHFSLLFFCFDKPASSNLMREGGVDPIRCMLSRAESDERGAKGCRRGDHILRSS